MRLEGRWEWQCPIMTSATIYTDVEAASEMMTTSFL